MGNRVYKPEEIYRKVSNIAPDLIVHFGGLYWRSIGSVGHAGLYLQENDTGPDGCNHALYGSFILAGARVPRLGEVGGAGLLDVAPTLLELGGMRYLGRCRGGLWWRGGWGRRLGPRG
jgi:predicted AlkP superfamily phosphohydrolase/phosphomutase